MNTELYQDQILVKRKSVFTSGETIEGYQSAAAFLASHNPLPVLVAFLNDNDLQEMTVVSTNIGFVNTYQKAYIRIVPPIAPNS